MAEKSYPFDGQLVYEDDWGKMARTWVADHVDAEATGQLKPTTPGGLISRLAAGRAFVRGFAYSNDANIDTTHTAPAVVGQKRIDTIVLRKDATANTVTMVVIPGVESTAPVAPAIQLNDDLGIWDMPLYDAKVAQTTVEITDRRFLHVPQDSRREGVGAYKGGPAGGSAQWAAGTMGLAASATIINASPGLYLVACTIVDGPRDGNSVGYLRVTARSNGFALINLTNDTRADGTDSMTTPKTWVGTYPHTGGDLTVAAYHQYASRVGQMQIDGTNISATLIKPALEEH